MKIKAKPTITKNTILQVARASSLTLSDQEVEKLQSAFQETLGVVENLHHIDTKGVDPTFQVTGLQNVLREDEVIEERMLSQEDALKNAKNTYQRYFVVDRIIDES